MEEIYSNIDTTLKGDMKIKKILQKIDALLDSIPELQAKKNDIRIVELVCNFLENYCNSKKYKIDKKKVVMDYLKQKFGLTPEELKALDNSIEFVVRNTIEKFGVYKSIKKYLSLTLKKRFLH